MHAVPFYRITEGAKVHERGGELPPRASLAAHLRSKCATEPAMIPSGRGVAQAVRLATMAGHMKTDLA